MIGLIQFNCTENILRTSTKLGRQKNNFLIPDSYPDVGAILTLRVVWTEVLLVSAKTKTGCEIQHLNTEVRDMLSWAPMD